MQSWDGLRRMLAATVFVQSAMLFDSVSAFSSSSNTSLRNDNALMTFYAAVFLGATYGLSLVHAARGAILVLN
jgi:hypothetical protein